MATLHANCIFTNCALTDDGDVWWEGMTARAHAEAPDRLARQRLDAGLEDAGRAPERALHRARRASARSSRPSGRIRAACRSRAILFGGRRASVVPLVNEARDWQHGTFLGSIIASEKTAAAAGKIGELRRDPMAMLPFCGYNMADYWSHWLTIGRRAGAKLPRLFCVNWFRKSDDGRLPVARLRREQPRAEVGVRALRGHRQGGRDADRQPARAGRARPRRPRRSVRASCTRCCRPTSRAGSTRCR